MTDIEIAKNVKLENIENIAKKAGIEPEDIECYGKYKAKISDKIFEKVKKQENGKLVLVTAISPTPLGEGKTTISIAIADGLQKIGKKSMLCLREPSLGPVFGIKGGATGGGHSQVAPMEDINLHFTGDIHAITSANNLLSAMIDNHIYFGNELKFKKVVWKRCVDLNDRQLRTVNTGLSGESKIVQREDHFDITVASEIMAIVCLSNDIFELREKLGNIIAGYNEEDKPIYAKDLKAQGAMAVLLKDAIKPNLVQTLEHTPALIHGGPFANIAHGCNSVRATRLALKLSDYAVTEAGFGADLGAEKFLDIKCRLSELKPDAVVIVATVRALKYNGGVAKDKLNEENMDALKAGIVNLDKHIENMQKFGIPVVVTLNAFITDTQEEYEFIKKHCEDAGCEFALAKVWEKGGEGGLELAEKVIASIENKKAEYKPIYEDSDSLKEKIEKVAKEIYGADGVTYDDAATKELQHIEQMGFGNFPVCIAKTQYSLSDNPKLLGRPENFTINVREAYVDAGAGFVVILTGKILTMPGLPTHPAAENINYDEESGKITGLF